MLDVSKSAGVLFLPDSGLDGQPGAPGRPGGSPTGHIGSPGQLGGSIYGSPRPPPQPKFDPSAT